MLRGQCRVTGRGHHYPKFACVIDKHWDAVRIYRFAEDARDKGCRLRARVTNANSVGFIDAGVADADIVAAGRDVVARKVAQANVGTARGVAEEGGESIGQTARSVYARLCGSSGLWMLERGELRIAGAEPFFWAMMRSATSSWRLERLALVWHRSAVEAALDQARCYADQQRVR
jgi:hypothetical protein